MALNGTRKDNQVHVLETNSGQKEFYIYIRRRKGLKYQCRYPRVLHTAVVVVADIGYT